MGLDGIIVMHRYYPSSAAECMASSVNNCIRMRISCSDGFRCNYDHMDAITNLPEVNNAMSFLLKNNFIAGPNISTATNSTCVSQCLTIGVNKETINNDKKDSMQYFIVYHLIRKTTKYSTAQRVNWMILLLWNLHDVCFVWLLLMLMETRKITVK